MNTKAKGFKWSAFAAQDIGGRTEQQDRVGIFTCRRLPDSILMVLADGVGGKTGGAMAAEQVMITAKNLFAEFAPSKESATDLFETIVSESHAVIKLTALSQEKEPHSTLVALLLRPDRADWIHIGDSRLYRFIGGDFFEHTVDHSYVEQLRAQGGLSEEQIQNHHLSSALLSALGMQQDPTVAYSSTESLSVGESFLLCSDGLWHYFENAELGAILNKYDPPQAADRLIQLARERSHGKGDNCSLAIVKLEPMIEGQ